MTVADLRARVPALTDAGRFPDADLSDLVAEFEGLAERYRGVAFTPREVSEGHVVVACTDRVPLLWPFARDITGTVDGDAVDFTVMARWAVADHALDYGQVVEVTYTHGLTAPPPELLRACRQYVRAKASADQSGVPRDVISQTVDGMTLRHSTPDWDKGRPTGMIDIDATLNGLDDYRVPVIA